MTFCHFYPLKVYSTAFVCCCFLVECETKWSFDYSLKSYIVNNANTEKQFPGTECFNAAWCQIENVPCPNYDFTTNSFCISTYLLMITYHLYLHVIPVISLPYIPHSSSLLLKYICILNILTYICKRAKLNFFVLYVMYIGTAHMWTICMHHSSGRAQSQFYFNQLPPA